MKKAVQRFAPPLGAAMATVLLAAGCGSDSGSGAGSGDAVVMGMTDEVSSIDPAAGYDPGSWLVFNNVFQSLLSFPKGATEPEPEAAKECAFEDNDSRVYTCTLQDGLKFSNGSELTSEDVKFSFERTIGINHPDGPAVMLDSIGEIETPDELTVTFRLDYPDATFPMKIASGAGSIVDSESYPKDKLREGGEAVGSGPYRLDSYQEGKEAVFSVYSGYKGTAELQNSGMTLKLYGGSGGDDQLKADLENGDIDLAYRGLAMKDIAELQDQTGAGQQIKLVEGTSAEVQHLVFNMEDPVAGDPAVRKAFAYLIDRNALVREVYRGTAEELYSIVPAGITGHNTAFYDTYGDRPDPARAEQVLRQAGIDDKVRVTLYATPERFGPGTVPSFELIAEQLNASGLFEADVKSVPLDEFDKGVKNGAYGVYVKGWVPDYPDPDNFTAPFFGKDNVLANNYEPGRITSELIPQAAAQSERTATVDAYGELQDIVADELPVIPLWQGKQYAAAQENILGLEWTLDASTVFRFWEISKGAE
ncbi:ABC transporter substrate-binding protein [Streptomyces sp. MAR4 CNX-425]|uniref:ABC transporter substrate-binding protein n=1 Tax=Streptomyces sp. MAR4 CNX-425 TaxID=3406343 RepID=UPI003B502326